MSSPKAGHLPVLLKKYFPSTAPRASWHAHATISRASTLRCDRVPSLDAEPFRSAGSQHHFCDSAARARRKKEKLGSQKSLESRQRSCGTAARKRDDSRACIPCPMISRLERAFAFMHVLADSALSTEHPESLLDEYSRAPRPRLC